MWVHVELRMEDDLMVKIGIIGGSGLEDPKILKDQREIECDTPYG